jgi:hypothetical protein
MESELVEVLEAITASTQTARLQKDGKLLLFID